MARRGAPPAEPIDDPTAVFVSYSRRDSVFVETVTARLESLGLDVWLDRDDIPPSAKWRDEIQDGIERCDALILIVTPDSARSDEVGKEVVRADQLGKRIVPVQHRQVDPKSTQAAVRDRNWVDWLTDDQADEALGKIDQSLKVDPDWTKEHTRLNGLALAWDRHRGDKSRLLTGAALSAAEEALSKPRQREQPQVTELMREFVTQSRTVATRRQRRLVITSLTVAVVSISLAIAAVLLGLEAERQRQEAVRQRDAATSTALASQSENRLAVEPDLSALVALEAYRTADTVDALGSLLRVNDNVTTFIDRFAAHPITISTIAVREEAGRVATADIGGGVVLWDLAEDGSAQRRSQSIDVRAGVTALAFDATGEQLTIAYDDGDEIDGVEIWRVPSDSTMPAERMDDIPAPVGIAALSPDGTVGASFVRFDDGTFGLSALDMTSGEFVANGSFDPSSDAAVGEFEPTTMVFSLDSAKVAFGAGGEIHVWSWRESDEIDVFRVEDVGIPDLERTATAITSVALIGDGDRIAFGIEEGDIYLAGIAGQNVTQAIAAQPASTSEALALTSITATSDDGTSETALASAHNNGQVRVWFIDGLNAFESATLRGHDEEVRAVALTTSGDVVSGSWDGDVIWSNVFPSARIGSSIVDPVTLTSHDSDVNVLEFVGTDTITSLGGDAVLRSWDPSARSATDALTAESVSSMGAAGDIVAMGNPAGVITVIDRAAQTTVEFQQAHDGEVTLIAVSHDGAMVASVDESDAVWLWSIDGESRTVVDTPDDFETTAIAFPGTDTLWIGGSLAVDGGDEAMALHIDTASGDVIERARHNDDELGHSVSSIALSPDGATLATGGSDRRIFLFDTADVSDERAELARHLEEVSDIVFLDDTVMFVGDRDGRILMWDVDATRPVGELTGPTDGVLTMALHPAGDSLIAGGEDDRIWIWDLRVDKWIEGACDLAGRNMTSSEWERFQLSDDPVNHCPEFGPDDRPLAVYPDTVSDAG